MACRSFTWLRLGVRVGVRGRVQVRVGIRVKVRIWAVKVGLGGKK